MISKKYCLKILFFVNTLIVLTNLPMQSPITKKCNHAFQSQRCFKLYREDFRDYHPQTTISQFLMRFTYLNKTHTTKTHSSDPVLTITDKDLEEDSSSSLLSMLLQKGCPIDDLRSYLALHQPSTVDYINTERRPPLFYAVEEMNQDYVKLLLSYNPRLKYCADIESVLFEAITQSDNNNTAHHTIIRLLCKTFQEDGINTRDEEGETPMTLAIDLDKPNILKILLEAGIDVNYPSEYCTPIINAIAQNSLEMVKLLLQTEAVDLEKKVTNRLPFKYIAIEKGETPLQVAEKLVKQLTTVDYMQSQFEKMEIDDNNKSNLANSTANSYDTAVAILKLIQGRINPH